MSNFKDEIKIQQEYYTALKETLKPNQQFFSKLKQELPDEYNWDQLQELVENHPDDTLLSKAMQAEDGLVLYCYLCQPLGQVILFCIMNCLPNLANDPLPPNYTLFDPESICEELKKLTMRGREQIFNYYYLIDYKYSEKLKIAITEPNIDAMKEIIESRVVDLSWVQRALGIFKYGNEMNESILNEDVPEGFEDGLFRDYLKSVFSDDIPYLDGYYDSLWNDGGDSLNKATGFLLKSYWYLYKQFRPKTREIIDAYINKPCFAEFVSKCRAEFEEEERLREESVEGEIVDADSEPVVEEVQKQAPKDTHIDEDKKIFTFRPTDNANNLFQESEFAFDGSKGLAEYAINNKEKIELFVHLLANRFHYILNKKSEAKAFVRTITGIRCDGGTIKPTLQSEEAAGAILYMAQHKILSGKMKNALQKFDFKGNVNIESKKKNPSSYAKRIDSEFVKLIAYVFGDYCGRK